MSIVPPKPDALAEMFNADRVIIGTVHLLPLPGSPQYDAKAGLNAILRRALSDAATFVDGGVDGLIVENSGDLPFLKPAEVGMETTAFLTRITTAIVEQVAVPVGVNCLANAVIPSVAAAAASGATFVRSNQWVNAYVANEGFVEGASAHVTRFRAKLRADAIRIFADVHVKHGSHAVVGDRGVDEQARDAEFFDADVLIATGSRTGESTTMAEVQDVARLTTLPVIVGSGIDTDNVIDLFKIARGAIVGSSLKVEGAWWNPVDGSRVERLVRLVREFGA